MTRTMMVLMVDLLWDDKTNILRHKTHFTYKIECFIRFTCVKINKMIFYIGLGHTEILKC